MVQYCSLCKNHGVTSEKKGHKSQCIYEGNHYKLCLDGCQETRLRQISVADEKRRRYKLEKLAEKKQPVPEGKKRAPKTCSKCRNHGLNSLMNLRHDCDFKNCKCEACKETEQRRGFVKNDVTNIRRNQSTATVFMTPPSTPGSSSSQSSPRALIEAASPLKHDVASPGEYSDSVPTPLSMACSPADLAVQSPAAALNSPEIDLFESIKLPDLMPPSALLVQQDSDMQAIEDFDLSLFDSLPSETQAEQSFDTEMTELLIKAINEYVPEIDQQELYNQYIETLRHQNC